MNVSAKAKWKSVPMDPQLKARGFAEGLLGIEELCDYDMLKFKKNKVISIQASKLTKKRKVSNVSSESSEKKKSKKDKDSSKTTEKDSVSVKKKKSKKDKFTTEVKAIEEKEDPKKIEATNESSTKTVDLNGWKEYNLPQEVMKALSALGFEDPTPIQRETLPAAINGRADVVGAAETGSGKTLAFGIPILSGILSDRNDMTTSDLNAEECEEDSGSDSEVDMEDPEAESGCVRVVNNVDFDFDVDIEESQNQKNFKVRKGNLRALVLTPTRELAMQVRNHLQALAKFTDVKVVAIVGGMAVQKQIRLLGQAPEIIVATPGRLWDIFQEGHPHLAQLPRLSYLAIDETDRMIEKGHFEEMQKLLEVINNPDAKNKRRQTFVFSATLSLVHDLPKHLSGNSKYIKERLILIFFSTCRKKGSEEIHFERQVKATDGFGWCQGQA